MGKLQDPADGHQPVQAINHKSPQAGLCLMPSGFFKGKLCTQKKEPDPHSFIATCFVAQPTQRNCLLSLKHPSLITFSSMEISTHQSREHLQISLTAIQTIIC